MTVNIVLVLSSCNNNKRVVLLLDQTFRLFHLLKADPFI